MLLLNDIHMEKYTPLLDFENALGFVPACIMVYLVSLFIHWRIFKFINRKKRQAFNKMIFYQQICLGVCSFQIIITTLGTIKYPVSDWIGNVGCHVMDFLQLYGMLLANSVSFYMALFRYICIIQAPKLQKFKWTTTDLAHWILTCQYLVPLVLCAIIRGFAEVTPYNAHDLFACLGRHEMDFLSGSGPSFCGGLDPWTSAPGFLCYFLGTVYMITSTNVPEMFMLWRIIQETRFQTRSIKQFLTLSSFERRQREDGIMFTVNVWQWLLEVFFILAFYMMTFVDFGSTELGFRIWFLYIFIHTHLVNAFYLLGDNLFQRSVTEAGVMKALWRAFLQSY